MGFSSDFGDAFEPRGQGRTGSVSRMTLTERIKRKIVRELRAQHVPEGTPIASERQFVITLGASRTTVRRAIGELIDEGVLYTIPGKGTFVAKAPPTVAGTGNVGCIFCSDTPSIAAEPYFMDFIAGIEMRCRSTDRDVMVATIACIEAERYPTMIEDRKVDGVLIAGPTPASYALIQKRVPAVAMANIIGNGSVLLPNGIDFVGARDVYSGWQMSNYLIDRGHRSFCYCSLGLSHSSFSQRRHGVKVCLDEKKQSAKYAEIIAADSHPEDWAEKILKQKPRPTAVIACNDAIALQIIEQLQARGVHVPGDISVAGFDDIHTGRQSRPALTTVQVPTNEMGAMAYDLLLRKLENAGAPPRRVLLETRLIERESVADAKR